MIVLRRENYRRIELCKLTGEYTYVVEPALNQEQIDTMAAALRRQGLTWSQTNFAVSLTRKAVADEVDSLRTELESAKSVNLAVVQRLQAEIETLKQHLEQSRKYERWAQHEADSMRDAQDRADDAYRAASSGY